MSNPTNGNDTLIGGTGNDSINGLGGNDNITGGIGRDTLYGDDGDDRLDGGLDLRDGENSEDYLDGGNGKDTLFGNWGNDLLIGGWGNDSLYGNGHNDSLYGGGDDDYHHGGVGDDLIAGWNGNDTLMGGLGNDSLYGDGDNDILTGSGIYDLIAIEQDTLIGGLGADIFVLGDSMGAHYQNDDTLTPPGIDTIANYATITDFDRTEGDKIQVYGSLNDYTLTPVGDGVEIYYQNDLIGYLENTNDIDPSIDFVTVQATDLEPGQEVEFAIDLVEDLGLVDEPIQVSEGVWFLGEGIPPDELNIVRPDNINSADTINTDQLWIDGNLGLELDGDGLTVGVWEHGGVIRDTHQELNGSVSIIDTGTDFSNHATHVAGTIAAKGLDVSSQGMATQVRLRSYDASNDIAEIERDAHLIVASNHSYTFRAGWDSLDIDSVNVGRVRNTDVWLGDYSTSSTEDRNFGKYNVNAQALDQVLFDNPHLLSVWSAANDRDHLFTDSHGNNTYVTFFSSDPNITGFNWSVFGSGWYQVATNVVAPPPGDGNGGTGYDSLTFRKVAKNTLVVGAIHDITTDPYNQSNVFMSDFSSWGPTDDGRIKPDVVANGVGLWSSGASSDTHYYSISGTSMAAPSVTGTATLLIEHYQNLFHSSPLSATTKGLLIHTAFDAENIGPDYASGWGVVDGAAAANFLTNLSDPNPSNLLFEKTYAGTEQSFTVTSDGTNPLKATIVWTDPAGSVQGNGLDVRTPVLVNDLDLWITGPDGTTYYPWTLDPANPANPAVQTSANNLDNVEQVLIDAPTSGEYTIHVDHSDDSFVQDYSLLTSGVDIDAPDLVVTSLRTTGLGSVDGNHFIQPIEVVVQNQGSLPAEPFKVSVDYQIEGQPSYVVAFTADETSDVNADNIWYPFTKNDLASEAEVTFTGKVTFNRDSLTSDISLWAVADSISSDEFIPDYGRVEESVEINNQSNPITLSLNEDLPLGSSSIFGADSSILDDSFSLDLLDHFAFPSSLEDV